MKKLLLVVLLLTACGRRVTVNTPPQMDDPNCPYMTTHADNDAAPPSCVALQTAFTRAVEHYATVDVMARTIKWTVANMWRPAEIKYEPGHAPRMKSADGVYIQASFDKPANVWYAHEGAIYCEALHMIAYMLNDAGWEMTGHEGPNDRLNFPCWKVVETEWLLAHPKPQSKNY